MEQVTFQISLFFHLNLKIYKENMSYVVSIKDTKLVQISCGYTPPTTAELGWQMA